MIPHILDVFTCIQYGKKMRGGKIKGGQTAWKAVAAMLAVDDGI